jgi:serine/threonine protein kinase
MPAPLTPEQLIELIRKSNLLEVARLDAYLKQRQTPAATAIDLAQDLIKEGLITNFQKEQLLQGKWRGYTIGKYKVLERLGAGGMGSVYLCEHLKMKHKVAVKVLPTAKACDPAALGRFYREARAAGVLDHPNLVRAHDIDQDGDLHYLVLDYVDGVNLQYLVTRFPGKFPFDRACHYIYQAAQGLEHAFERGLIHRDIKPANLLLDRQGTIRILDMGLARFYEDNQDLLTLKYDDNNVLGTADYVSPEQAMDSHDVDIRTDIYSLGATFYFMLTGKPLFPDGRVAQKLIWQKDREPTPIHELRPDVPPDLEALVMKMLAKEREDRYQSPAEVMAALEPWVETPIAPPGDSEIPQMCPAARVSPNEGGSGGKSPAGRAPSKPSRPDSTNRHALRAATHAVTALPAAGPSAEHATPHRLDSEESTARTRAVREEPAPVKAAAPAVRPVAQRSRAGRIFFLSFTLSLGALAGFFFRLSMRGTEPPPPQTEVGKRILVVDRSHRGDTHASIADALRLARSGDIIEVREPVWEEVLRLESGGILGRGVTLIGKGPDGKPTIWQPPAGQTDVPSLVHLSAVSGLRLQNFTLDGKDAVQHLVTISGPSVGLTLQELTLAGFRSSGVRLTAAVAEEQEPLLLDRLQIQSGRDSEAGILLDSLVDQPSKYVRINQCKIKGPGQAGVAVSGPVHLQMTRCEVTDLGDGVIQRRASVPLPVQLTLTGNNFRNLERGALRLETPLRIETSQLVLNDNRFERVKVLGWLEGFKPEPARTPAGWIWSKEPASGPSKVYLRKRFTLESAPNRATLSLTADESFTVWINGQRAAQGTFSDRTHRIQAFDVARFLRQGDNVLAVEAFGRAGRAGVLAELDDNGSGIFTRTLVSDTTWKVSSQPITGWQEAAFDEKSWPEARMVTPYGKGEPAWQQLIWEGLVQEHFKFQTDRIFPAPTGNTRDAESSEGFPLFEAVIKPRRQAQE